MNVKSVKIDDIQGVRMFDGIGCVIREPEVGSIEGAVFKLNTQPPHWIFIYFIPKMNLQNSTF